MLKKFFITLFITTLLLFSACNKNSLKKNKQHLTLNIVSEPQSLDPRKVRDLNAVNLSKILFDGLMRLTKNGSIEYAIAESFSLSEDGKTYIFKLKDTYWSNGDKLTAYDFEYTLKSSLSPNFTSNASSLNIIKGAKKAKKNQISLDDIGIKTIDEKTLIFELKKPCPYFLNLLTCPVFFAVNKNMDQKDPKWAQSKNNFVSNGAFTLADWKKNDELICKKNEHYWDKDKVKLQKISMLMLTNDVELNMFELNQLDIAGSPFSSIIVDSLQKLKQDKSYHVAPYFGTSFLRVNSKKISDLNFRKDLINAFDRKKITEHVLQGGQLATSKLVPVKKEMNVPIIKKDYDAKKITLTYVSDDRSHILAQALQRDFKENLNLEVNLKAIERKTYYEKLGSLDYELALSSWIADFADPIDFLNVFKYKDSSTNNTGWENESYIKLLEKSERVLDAKDRQKLLDQAEDILLSEAPIIPLYHLTQNFLQKENLKDLKIYPSGFLDLKYAYFE